MTRMKRATLAGFFVLGVLPVGTGCELITAIDHNTIEGDEAGSAACGLSCASVGACPTPANECIEATCDQRCCGTRPRTGGSKCSAGVCDGQGNCVGCNTKEECPAPSTACKVRTCTAQVCGTEDAARGAACTDNHGLVCNGSGRCLGCNSGADCPGAVCHPTSSICVPIACANGAKDGTETAIDCGGDPTTCPARCGQFKACLVDGDCVSGNCDPDSKNCN